MNLKFGCQLPSEAMEFRTSIKYIGNTGRHEKNRSRQFFWGKELPPKQGGHDEMWWKTSRTNQDTYYHAKKIWGRMQAAAYMFMNRHQCPVQGCVCGCTDAPTNRATFQMPRKQTLKPNNQPTSNRNDSTSHQSKARFWTFTSSPPLAMGAKTNGASRFTAAFLSWSWLLTSYADYGSRMPNVATLPSDLMEIGIFWLQQAY